MDTPGPTHAKSSIGVKLRKLQLCNNDNARSGIGVSLFNGLQYWLIECLAHITHSRGPLYTKIRAHAFLKCTNQYVQRIKRRDIL